jgi:hypothetical protein
VFLKLDKICDPFGRKLSDPDDIGRGDAILIHPKKQLALTTAGARRIRVAA